MEERHEVSEQEMDIAAVLDVYVYTDQKGETYNNQTLAKIVDGSTDEYCQSVKAITDNNPRIANMELLDQSSVSQPDAPYINNEYITACTFRDPETNDIYVCFCGTRDGQWIDDGEALVNENSVMQEEAVKYFDYEIRLSTYLSELVLPSCIKGKKALVDLALKSGLDEYRFVEFDVDDNGKIILNSNNYIKVPKDIEKTANVFLQQRKDIVNHSFLTDTQKRRILN